MPAGRDSSKNLQANVIRLAQACDFSAILMLQRLNWSAMVFVIYCPALKIIRTTRHPGQRKAAYRIEDPRQSPVRACSGSGPNACR